MIVKLFMIYFGEWCIIQYGINKKIAVVVGNKLRKDSTQRRVKCLKNTIRIKITNLTIL